jgi:hypothetical protein
VYVVCGSSFGMLPVPAYQHMALLVPLCPLCLVAFTCCLCWFVIWYAHFVLTRAWHDCVPVSLCLVPLHHLQVLACCSAAPPPWLRPTQRSLPLLQQLAHRPPRWPTSGPCATARCLGPGPGLGQGRGLLLFPGVVPTRTRQGTGRTCRDPPAQGLWTEGLRLDMTSCGVSGSLCVLSMGVEICSW